jgi:prepilin-type N-terminal cleavage/methylation domain-containing protein
MAQRLLLVDQAHKYQEKQMKSQQSGFTLVEIAIVLVIIGLLLGGILKGQELINSAKVKNLANDFRTVPTYIYAYQDKYKALPGDDGAATTHMSTCTGTCANGNANGVINGAWDSVTATDESWQFWGHVRKANLAPGPDTWTTAANTDPYAPKNVDGGRIGVQSGAVITGMSGTYSLCSSGLLGKFAKQLDIQMDDGNTAAGSLRAHADGAALGSVSTATASIDDALPYTVCMTF